ncbi:BRO1-domain-containing protein [Wallemia mellicola]|uniref:BRO1-domain-containing protein n=1 Tax=Wallemia mellicola TaxID=1708541 RepID=A0A4T0QKH4_9BASI|nr:BRO1-domain-containing protein [Wallemia mellicola]TIC08405.1 BRO1-domain-containing protein [Wallemia mellicola]TIC24899.1 BRO1-domain-containing protein [Wallemia mellicola]TIC73754.1 BRO1-domain-containing protein [Wallemia mellicola]
MNQLGIPYKHAKDISKDIVQSFNNYLNSKSIAPEQFEGDINRWTHLRRQSMITHDTSTFMEYYNQINHLLTKLPQDIDLNFEFSTPFPDSSAFSVAENYAQSDINYEKCALLFNIAAWYSQKATHQSRNSTESIKGALQDLQLSSGVFDLLIENLSSLKTPTTTPDLSPNYLKVLSILMLAQAQECYWQKAVLDNLKNGTIAKVSLGVSNLYEEACQLALHSTPTPADAFPSIWISHIQVKAHHFAAAAQYRKSLDDLSSSRYGEELSRLNLAAELVKKAMEFSKRNKVFDAVRDDLKGLQDTLTENISRATRDNDLIYLHDVPHPKALPIIQPARMVKGVIPTDLTNGAIPKDALLFSALTPFAVDHACDLWSNRKNYRVREFEQRCAQLDKLQAEALHALGLPGSLQAVDRTSEIPPSLLKKIEELQNDGGLEMLEKLSDEVQLLAFSNENVIDETIDILNQEQDEDEEVRTQQPQLVVPPSSTVNAPFLQEVRQLQQTLEAASRSDGIVQEKISASKHDLELLSSDVDYIKTILPKGQSTHSINDENTRKLRGALEQLDDVVDDRRVIVQDVRSIVKRDNIRPKIIKVFQEQQEDKVDMGVFDGLYESEMLKYDQIYQEFESNSNNQESLLSTIRQLYNAFEKRKETDKGYIARQEKLQALDLAYYTYIEIKNNLSEGLQFYNDFSKLAHELKGSVENFLHQRRIEKQVAIEKLSKHIESLTLEESRESITNSPLKTFARIPESGTSHQFGAWDESKPIRFG